MSIFKKIWAKIKQIFSNKKAIENAVHIGINVVELLKTLVENPITPVLNAIIPGGIDDMICQQLKSWLPKILVELTAAGKVLELGSADAIVGYAVEKLKALPIDQKKKVYLDIAAMVTHALSKDSDGGSNITYAEIKEIVQYIYDHQYKNQ